MDPTRSTRIGGAAREDCWSDGATEALIEAWGDRYITLNRGNLRQKDWREVSDAVNSRRNGFKPKKTDIQCKNRIDTLKKKLKIEKSKPPPSKWPFYYSLDSLIGVNANPFKKKKPPNNAVNFKKSYTEREAESTSFNEEEGEEEEEEEEMDFDERVIKKEHKIEDVEYSDGAACRELARAILRFGEIYERIESSKQQQMFELEKQRMEFTKEVEFQRLNLFSNALLHFQKTSSSSGKKL